MPRHALILAALAAWGCTSTATGTDPTDASAAAEGSDGRPDAAYTPAVDAAADSENRPSSDAGADVSPPPAADAGSDCAPPPSTQPANPSCSPSGQGTCAAEACGRTNTYYCDPDAGAPRGGDDCVPNLEIVSGTKTWCCATGGCVRQPFVDSTCVTKTGQPTAYTCPYPDAGNPTPPQPTCAPIGPPDTTTGWITYCCPF